MPSFAHPENPSPTQDLWPGERPRRSYSIPESLLRPETHARDNLYEKVGAEGHLMSDTDFI